MFGGIYEFENPPAGIEPNAEGPFIISQVSGCENDALACGAAVEVTFDPERISYRELLEFFFQFHRADLGEHLVGSSYRSAIFCASEEQRKVAEETIRDVDASGHWPGKVVTEISEAGPFWEAQAEDQDYFQRYPEGCAPPFPRQGAEAAKR